MRETESSQTKSFWSTVPGILTAVTGTIGAIAALVTALSTAGYFRGEEPKPPPPELYRVVGVAHNDYLSVRPKPGKLDSEVGKIPPNGTTIRITGGEVKVGKSVWVPIRCSGKRLKLVKVKIEIPPLLFGYISPAHHG